MNEQLDVKEMVDKTLAAFRWLKEQGQSIMPTAFFLCPDGQIEVTCYALRNVNDQEEATLDMKRRAEVLNAVVILVMDAWKVKAQSVDDIERINREGAEAQPGRQEVLIVSVFGKGVNPSMAEQTYTHEGGQIQWEPLRWREEEVSGPLSPRMEGARA